MYNKRNLIIVGLLLLLIFGGAVWLVGVKIDATANRMHDSMVGEVGRYRSELIALDFRKTVGLAESIGEYIGQNPGQEHELQQMLRLFVCLDAKVDRIWYRKGDRTYIYVDSAGVYSPDSVLVATWEKIAGGLTAVPESRLYDDDGILYWTLCRTSRDIVFGLDISLPRLHDYFARMSPAVRSYAYVLDAHGVLIVHPDEKMIGRRLTGPVSREQFHKVIREGRVLHDAVLSEYLLLPVKRVFYPVAVGTEKWVVVVNVPDLVTQEEMNDFHRYTLLIALFAVFVFCVLWAFSQYKWRKEYDRRRKLEQEALQLNLQQLKNQVNPHFLFNALNSLSVLTGQDPVLAKEFVLKLSKIYRYVLEKRNDHLVTVREELALIRDYYFLQKIRFGEQLNLEIADDAEHEERMIPLMSMQMLIENAIKHNEISRQYPLYIRVFLVNDDLIVENSYHPRSDASHDSLGVGFENIRKIYEYCSDKQFDYKIEGDRFICILPLI